MMTRALQLARRGRYSAMPNPHVGCVLVRDNSIIGEGFTQPAGGNHAEIEALEAAGDAAGATAYVTLEPCSHHGKTGPCTEALIAAGVKRVVAAMPDPNPLVAGEGIKQLRGAGIDVDVGLLESEARRVIPGFIARMTRGRGRVRAKLAMSLDGRTAMASGESQWITGTAARKDVQRLRAASCAIVTGVGTVVADDCALTVRSGELGMPRAQAELAAARQPLRVVLDSNLTVSKAARILGDGGPSLICHRKGVVPDADLTGSRAEFLELADADGGLNIADLMTELAKRQCNEILIESGPRVAGSFLRAGLLDELIVYVAPTLMGSDARPLLQLPLQQMAEKIPLRMEDVRKVGDDWRFTVKPV